MLARILVEGREPLFLYYNFNQAAYVTEDLGYTVFAIAVSPSLLVILVGFIFAVLTLVDLVWIYLRPPIGGARHSPAPSLRVLGLFGVSLINTAFLVVDFVYLVQGWHVITLRLVVTSFLTWVVVPVITSVVDPIVYLVLRT